MNIVIPEIFQNQMLPIFKAANERVSLSMMNNDCAKMKRKNLVK